jgi:hypothetical protein
MGEINGLTFDVWIRKAKLAHTKLTVEQVYMLYDKWLAGEYPTKYSYVGQKN